MKVIVNNLSVEYQESGTGSVLLFLHGWKDDLRTFDELVPFLVSSFRIIRVDLPGFGASERPKESWEVKEYVAFVKAFTEKLGLSVGVLVGHSFGGRIILKGVGDGTLHPQKVVLIASAGLAKHMTPRSLLFGLGAKIGKTILFVFPASVRNHFRQRLYKYAGSEYLDAGELKETFLKVTREDLSSSARSIHIPTLLIWGERDGATPLSDGKRLHTLISRSKLEVILGAGHFVHKEKPQEVARSIDQFIKQ